MSTLNCTPLTHGPSAHYPLYYFIPSFTEDGEFMVVHKETHNDVLLCRLHIPSGECIPLTAGKTQRAGRPSYMVPGKNAQALFSYPPSRCTVRYCLGDMPVCFRKTRVK